jgi:hypothetical protein
MEHGKIKYDSQKVVIQILLLIVLLLISSNLLLAQEISRADVVVNYEGIFITVGGDYEAFKSELISKDMSFKEDITFHQDWETEQDWRRPFDDYPDPNFDVFSLRTEGLIVERFRGDREIIAIILTDNGPSLSLFDLSVGDFLPEFTDYYAVEYSTFLLLSNNPPDPNSPSVYFDHDQENIISEITISIVSKLYNVEGQK